MQKTHDMESISKLARRLITDFKTYDKHNR